MAKSSIRTYSTTAASNTDVGGVDVQGTAPASNMDDAVREIMSHLAETNAGTAPLDDTFSLCDPADATKKVRIDAGSVTAGQTRVLTMPDANVTLPSGTLVTETATQTFTNKSLSDSTTSFVDNADATKKVQFQLSAITTGTTRTVTVPDKDGTMAMTSDISVAVPIGTIIDYAGATEPTGWLFCYGQAISRTTYSSLFSVISTTYGTGNGTTTFNVPDIRGRVVAGQDDMGGVSADRLTNQSGGVNGDTLGATGGAETHTLTIAQMPAHTHSVSASGTASYQSGSSTASDNTSDVTGSTGGDGAHNNVQPTIILNKIIYTGV